MAPAEDTLVDPSIEVGADPPFEAATTSSGDRPVIHLDPGFLYGVTWGRNGGHGPGLELSVPVWIGGDSPIGGGPYLQGHWFRDTPRLSYGLELFAYGLGLEVGWSTGETGDADRNGVHLGPFVSAGILHLAGRFVIPVQGAAGEAGFVCGLKLPIPVYGEWRFGVPHGRPLRVAGRPVRAPIVLGARGHQSTGLDASTRAALVAAWLEDARMEHASVAAFRQIETELRALGAPSALIHGARAAAADERDHARRCLEIVSALVGRAVFLAPIAVPPTLPDRLRLATESLREGSVGEAVAAEEAARAADRAHGPVRNHLQVIARDEARHAELSRAIVAWAVATGGDSVRRSTQAARDALPNSVPPRPEPEGTVATRFGRPGVAIQRAAYASVIGRRRC